MEIKFVVDVHLGKLARLLRLFGFNTVYSNDFSNSELINISREGERILLSRNITLSKKEEIRSFVISSEEPLEQLQQVITHFNLKADFRPFSRCTICNGTLQVVSKETIAHSLQKNTSQFFNDFRQCIVCGRIYWKGSHYQKMLKTIQSMVA